MFSCEIVSLEFSSIEYLYIERSNPQILFLMFMESLNIQSEKHHCTGVLRWIIFMVRDENEMNTFEFEPIKTNWKIKQEE